MDETERRSQSCETRIDEEMKARAEHVRRLLVTHQTNGEQRFCAHCGAEIHEETYGPHGVDDHFETQWENVQGDALCSVLAATPGTGNRWHEPDEDYTEDSLYEFGLGISQKVLLRYEISTGGPGDWLEIVCNEIKHTSGPNWAPVEHMDRLEVERVVYHFNDWFDHAERTVAEDSPLWQLAEWVAETQQ